MAKYCGWHSWEEALFDAYLQATESPDPSSQNGAVVYDVLDNEIGRDCNRFPDGVKDLPERWERPLKYQIVGHAESNAIYRAAARGFSTAGGTMVCPWAACDRCAVSIINSGIKRLVRHQEAMDRNEPGSTWYASCAIADMMFEEAGVEILNVSAKMNGQKWATIPLEIRYNEKIWMP